MAVAHDLCAPRHVSIEQLPEQLYSMVAPGLFMGGTADDAWVNEPKALDYGDDDRGFDAVLTLFSWAQPFGWGVEELRYGFADSNMRQADLSRVVEAARWAYKRWSEGNLVLIRCQAGLNRSGLLTALVLMQDGLSAEEAIGVIRAERGEAALFNRSFVDWLVGDAESVLAGRFG